MLKRGPFLALQGALGLSLALFLWSLATRHVFAANLLSVVSDVVAAGVMTLVVWKVKAFKANWLCFLGAVLAWMGGDLAWTLMADLKGADPRTVTSLTVVYSLPNLFIGAATLAYFLRRASTWDRGRMYLNLAATLTIGISVTWILMFNTDSPLLVQLDANRLSSFLTLVLDGLTAGCLALMYLNTRIPRLSMAYRLLLLGILLYLGADLAYTYQIFHAGYAPFHLVDGVYATAIALFAAAGLVEIHDSEGGSVEVLNSPGMKGNASRRMQILFLAPLLVLAFHGFRAAEMVLLVGLVVAYQLASLKLQEYRQQAQLVQEQRVNQALDAKVQERTQDLMDVNARLDLLAKTDPVTGLFNRRYFLEALDGLIAQGLPMTLYYLDLNRFKTINDTHGHEVGDRILCAIGERLSRLAQPGIVLARMGGDEFVLACPRHATAEAVTAFSIRIVDACFSPVVLGGLSFQIGVSIGVACFPEDGTDASILLRHADLAMYRAKREGIENWVRYSPELSGDAKRRNEIELLLQAPVTENHFQLYYQPQFSLPDRRLVGMEALIRWRHPQLGVIPPGLFIPIAEETNAILALGEWIMATAVNQISDWNSRYGLDLRMGINLSPVQLDLLNLKEDVANLMAGHAVDPAWIDLEVTETSAVKGGAYIEERLRDLAGLGVSLSIDDFGTGYSSLAYLRRFDIHRLKIAKELVDGIHTSSEDAGIVRAIVAMAKCLGLKTIAEGVELEEQFQVLVDLGCDEVQGYLTGHPLDRDAFEQICLAPRSGEYALMPFLPQG
jgi:diguanylate cyclase (GGDEF)-like protein